MRKLVIVIADRDEALRRRMKQLLLRQETEIVEVADKTTLLQTLGHQTSPDLLILSSALDVAEDGLAIVRQIRRRHRLLPLILLAATSSEDLAIAALRAGVTDYFKPPLSCEELTAGVSRILVEVPQRLSPGHLANSNTTLAGHPRMIGQSPPMQQLAHSIEKAARTANTVLITGETGTGKELIAELIHQNSPRHQRTFIRLNCAAIPDSLVESELFGYERGAFTGAQSAQDGQFKRADGGTIFLDEIGDLSPYAQAKILRALEYKEIQRLGGKGNIAVDVRVIAATNQDLERLQAEGKFRSDLYFRLNIVRLQAPPLRERPGDIALLCHHYIQELNCRYGSAVRGFTRDALAHLLCYDWPGNVRELKNLLEAIFVDLSAQDISFNDLPEQFRRQCGESADFGQHERERMLSVLLSTNWNKSQAAQQLHWSRATLYRKMAKYRIADTHGPEKDSVTLWERE